MKTFTRLPVFFSAVSIDCIDAVAVCRTHCRFFYRWIHQGLCSPLIALLLPALLTLLISACESSDTTVGPPKNIPQNLTINPGTRVIELAWSGVSRASGYSVYWSNQAGVSKTQGTAIHTTLPHLEHRELANGQTYYYVVTAYTGSSESRESVEVSATPKVAPPTSPNFLSARGGDGRVTLRWNAIPGASHYSLYWNTHGGVGHGDARIDHVVSPFVHSDLSNNQDYYYILVAENAAGSSSASPEMSAQPQMPAPSAPIIEQLSNATGQVTIHWRNVSNANTYTLYWNTNGEVSTGDTAIEQVTNPYTVAPLNDDTSYYYRLQAHNPGGDSPLSNEAQASPLDNNSITPPGAVPGEPVGTMVRLGNGQINLDWPAVDGAIGYNLYWSTNASGEIIPEATWVEKLTHLQSPYSHIGLNNGTTYRYRLSAFNHQGESELSAEVNGSPQLIIPGVPAGVGAISGDERIAVRWNDVQGASGYTLYLDDQQGDARAIPNVNSPYEASGLRNNTSYQIEVTAYNAQSESQRSAAITITPYEPVPNAPQRISAQPGNGQVLLQWDSALAQDPNDSAQNIRGYRVYYDTRRGNYSSDSHNDNSVDRTLLNEQDSNVEISQIEDNRWQLTHTGLKNSQRYYYVVTALNDGGESRASSTVWARPEIPIPNAPSQVWAEAGDNKVVIHFTKADSSVAPVYNLYWSKQQTNGLRNTSVISNIEPDYRFSEGPGTNGNTYDFQVSAFNDGGESVLSRVVSASPQVPPPAQPPQDLQTSVQPGQVTLSWNPLSDASGYVIYWSIDAEIDPNTSARLAGIDVQPGYQHTGLVNGEVYYYQIAAVNPGGESTLSQAVIAKPQVYPPAMPSAPSLSAGDASVNIDFTVVDGATSYTLFWHTDPDADPGLWSQKHGIESGNRLENLSNDQEYYFKLAANNAGGQSALSATSSAVPKAPIPATPSGVSAIAGDGRVRLNWHTKLNVTYTLYWSDNANENPINSSNLIDNVRPSYIHTGLGNNTAYTYQLTARNNSGDSAATPIITATPKAPGTNPVNQAPQISEGDFVNVTMDEDAVPTAFSLSLSASDADNDPLSWSLNRQPNQGSASVSVITTASTVSIGYTPNANYQGTDSFAIQVSDDRGGRDVISVNVTINPQNDAPTIRAQMSATITTAEDTPLTLTLNHLVVSDPDNSYPEDFTLTVQAGSNYRLSGNTITPNANYNGTLSVPVSVNDGNVQSNVFNVAINVNSTNDAPIAVNDSYTVSEGGTLNISAPGLLNNDTDADGDTLRVNATAITPPSNGTLTLSADGSFIYIHNGAEATNDSFTYEITDGLATATAMVSITLTPENDVPIAVNDSYTLKEGGTLNISVPGLLSNDTDADGDALRVNTTAIATPSNGTLTLNTDGSFTYIHNGNEATNDSFAYEITDGLATAAAMVSITLTPENDAPIAVNDSYTVNEGGTLNISAPGLLSNDTDVDGDALRAITTPVSPPSNGSVTLNADGSFTYVHNDSETSSDSFMYEITDDIATAAAVVNIAVTARNDAPSATNLDAAEAYSEGDSAFNLAAIVINDPDSANVTATLTLSAPTAGSIATATVSGVTSTYNAVSGVWQASGALADVNTLLSNLSFTPAPNYDQSYTIITSVDDGNAPAVTGIKAVTLSASNDAPVITGQTPSPISLIEDTALTIGFSHLLVTDSDNDYPAGYTLTVNAGANYTVSGTTITPTLNYNGPLNVPVRVNDGLADSNLYTLQIDVTPQNDAPEFTSPNTATIEENTTAVMTVTATDADNDSLTYTLSGGVDQTFFSIDSNSGVLSFITAPDFEAPADADGDNVYQVDVSVNDGSTSVSQEISVSVTQAPIPLAGLFADANLQRCVDESGWVNAHEVTALRCNGYGISNLAGIKYLTNLQTLRLSRNVLADLNGLAGANLSSLTWLTFDNNQLTDISGLASAGLSNLQTLSLSSNALGDLNGLAGANLSSLTDLDLGNNQLTDISWPASAGLSNLHTLHLGENALADLNGLAGANLSSLTHLYLYSNQLTDISWLASAGLSNLQTLELFNNALADLNGLAGANLSSITFLNLFYNQLTDISGLASAGFSNALFINLFNNITISCTDLQSLISSLGWDQVIPSTAEDGVTCMAP